MFGVGELPRAPGAPSMGPGPNAALLSRLSESLTFFSRPPPIPPDARIDARTSSFPPAGLGIEDLPMGSRPGGNGGGGGPLVDGIGGGGGGWSPSGAGSAGGIGLERLGRGGGGGADGALFRFGIGGGGGGVRDAVGAFGVFGGRGGGAGLLYGRAWVLGLSPGDGAVGADPRLGGGGGIADATRLP